VSRNNIQVTTSRCSRYIMGLFNRQLLIGRLDTFNSSGTHHRPNISPGRHITGPSHHRAVTSPARYITGPGPTHHWSGPDTSRPGLTHHRAVTSPARYITGPGPTHHRSGSDKGCVTTRLDTLPTRSDTSPARPDTSPARSDTQLVDHIKRTAFLVTISPSIT